MSLSALHIWILSFFCPLFLLKICQIGRWLFQSDRIKVLNHSSAALAVCSGSLSCQKGNPCEVSCRQTGFLQRFSIHFALNLDRCSSSCPLKSIPKVWCCHHHAGFTPWTFFHVRWVSKHDLFFFSNGFLPSTLPALRHIWAVVICEQRLPSLQLLQSYPWPQENWATFCSRFQSHDECWISPSVWQY